MSERIDAMSEPIDPMSERIDAMSEPIDPMSERIDAMSEPIDPMSERIDAMSERIDPMSARIVLWPDSNASMREVMSARSVLWPDSNASIREVMSVRRAEIASRIGLSLIILSWHGSEGGVAFFGTDLQHRNGGTLDLLLRMVQNPLTAHRSGPNVWSPALQFPRWPGLALAGRDNRHRNSRSARPAIVQSVRRPANAAPILLAETALLVGVDRRRWRDSATCQGRPQRANGNDSRSFH
jgi:hypothetical protein